MTFLQYRNYYKIIINYFKINKLLLLNKIVIKKKKKKKHLN